MEEQEKLKKLGGGGSGGGSINIFYTNISQISTLEVKGGSAVNYSGAGGDGTVTIGRILDGTFVKE